MKIKRFLDFLNNIVTKSILLASIPLIMSLIDNYSGQWDVEIGVIENLLINKKLFSLVFVAYVILIGYYGYQDKKEKINKQDRDLLEKFNKAFSAEINSFTAIFDISQKNIRSLTRYFLKSNSLDLREWNFEVISIQICQAVYNVIKEISESGSNFTVNIYKKETDIINGNTNNYVTMIAHEGEYKNDVSIFGVRKLVSNKNKEYLNIRQFYLNKPKETILIDKEEIKKAFKFNGDYEKYKDEYNQYIGIPICCSGNNIMALLEIVAHDTSVIASKKEDIEIIINKYLCCFKYFALMSLKIEENMESTAIRINNLLKGADENEKGA